MRFGKNSWNKRDAILCGKSFFATFDPDSLLIICQCIMCIRCLWFYSCIVLWWSSNTWHIFVYSAHWCMPAGCIQMCLHVCGFYASKSCLCTFNVMIQRLLAICIGDNKQVKMGSVACCHQSSSVAFYSLEPNPLSVLAQTKGKMPAHHQPNINWCMHDHSDAAAKCSSFLLASVKEWSFATLSTE